MKFRIPRIDPHLLPIFTVWALGSMVLMCSAVLLGVKLR